MFGIYFLGDGGCGKTALIQSYFRENFQTDYISTSIYFYFISIYYYLALDLYEFAVEGLGNKFNLTVCDTSGQEGFEELRSLQYGGANLFIICYNVIEPASFNNVQRHWIQELNKEAEGIPAILCGNKLDLVEENKNCKFVTEEVANQLKDLCSLFSSHQCSSKDYVKDKTTGKVDEVYNSVLACTLASRKKTRRKICILL